MAYTFYYVCTDGVGVNLPRLENLAVRTIDYPDGAKVVALDFTTANPAGNGHFLMSVPDWKALVAMGNKAVPQLTTVPGTKK